MFLLLADSKQRLKLFKPISRPITCSAFNAQGDLFAYASSYDWSKGAGFSTPGAENEIFIHSVADSEIAPQPRKASKGG